MQTIASSCGMQADGSSFVSRKRLHVTFCIASDQAVAPTTPTLVQMPNCDVFPAYVGLERADKKRDRIQLLERPPVRAVPVGGEYPIRREISCAAADRAELISLRRPAPSRAPVAPLTLMPPATLPV